MENRGENHKTQFSSAAGELRTRLSVIHTEIVSQNLPNGHYPYTYLTYDRCDRCDRKASDHDHINHRFS